MSTLTDPTLVANSVSALAVILSGLMTLVFCFLVAPQPPRWLWAYWCVFITGIPTLWFHGFGETFPARVADVGTNLLLAWAMQVAALGDFYSRRTQWIVGGISGAINLIAVIWMLVVGNDTSRTMIFTLAPNSGFRIMQVILIVDSVFAVGVLYSRRSLIPLSARPLLYLVTVALLGGTLFASRGNHDLDGVLAYHAIWHTIAAFSFVMLWGFNHKRFNLASAG